MNHKISKYFDSNIKLLEQHHPDVWRLILEKAPKPSGTIFRSQSGKPNLTTQNAKGKLITFHDEKIPENDSNLFLSKIPADHKGFISILGMGLGYAVLNILKERPLLQYLAIFEKDPGIFIQALHHMDLSTILQDPRLILSVGSEQEINNTLKKAKRTIQLEDSNIYNHQPSFNYDPDGYKELMETLFKYVNSLNVGGATTRALGKDFLNNRFKHVCTIHHHRLLEQIQNKFYGEPAILVAGGPSLDKNVHLLKQVQENAVILAVDTVLPTLLANGIHPHFLASIDPKNLTYEKFADAIPGAKDIALICSSWVNLRTPKVFPASQVFWTFTAKPMEAWINSLLGGKTLNGGASTVAHLNLIAAHMLGCDPIVFIGQDLAFPGSATHAKGTVLHGSAPVGISIGKKIGETVKGVDGKLLRTDRSFLSMKQHFESFISKAQQTHINSTEGGAHIEGTKVLPLQEVIDTYCSKKIEPTRRIKEYDENIGFLSPDKMLKGFQKMVIKIDALKKEIKKADKIALSLSKEITVARKNKASIRSYSMLSPQQQKKIRKIDQHHKSIDSSIDVWKILEEITMDGLKESERNRQEISLLQNNPQKYMEWLLKNFDRLSAINKIRNQTLSLLEDNLNMVLSFHQKESKHRQMSEQSENIGEHHLKLARLYMDSKNYFIAKPFVEKLYQINPKSAELCFYLGCIAAQTNDHKKADLFFEKAVKISPDIKQKIDSFQIDLGDEFLKFVQYFNSQPGRKASAKYMIFKGLKYCPNHEKLKTELDSILTKELKSIKDQLQEKNYSEAEPFITDWHDHICKNDHLAHILSPSIVSQIFFNAGKLFVKEKKYSKALSCLQTAITFTPDWDDLHFMTIDTFFISNDFDGAIQAIKNAISIDTKFAAYWETIGDSLQSAGENEDAIIAYEQCFMNLPESIHLLKKIGDCYLATDQLEAAKISFEQYKLKMGNKNNP